MKNIIIAILSVIAVTVFAGCTQQIIKQEQGVKLQPGSYSDIILDPKAPVVTENFRSVEELTAFIKANSRGPNYGYAMAGGVRMMAESAMPDAAMTKASPTAADSIAREFSETNNQVAGVDEADTTKTDGEYIYTVSNGIVYIVKAYPGEDAKVEYKIRLEDAMPQGLFVYGDRLAVFGDYQNYEWLRKSGFSPRSGMTFFNVYDTSDKANPKLLKEYKFEGSYFNARMMEGDIYFIARSSPTARPIPMPIIMEGLDVRNVAIDRVFYYNIPYNNPQFVTVHAIGIDNAELLDSQTVAVEDSQVMYMSEKNIYITYTEYINEWQIRQKALEELVRDRIPQADKDLIEKIKSTDDDVLSRYEKEQKIYDIYQNYVYYLPADEQEELEDDVEDLVKKKMDEYEYLQFTVINKLGVSRGKITVEGNGKVPGRIMNQFSMDESGSHFRIATTIDQVWTYMSKRPTESTNNVYVLDDGMNIVGKLEGLAETEQIYSTRFIDDRLYMVTFRQVDPFFVIDLSDPKKPKELGQLKIPGFSRYLHPYDKDTIIGIGQEATDSGRIKGLKISLFDVRDVSKPKEVAKFVTEERYAQSTALFEHKAFLFDRDKELLVIPAYSYDYGPWERGGSAGAGYNGAFVFNIRKDGIELRGLIDHSQSSQLYWQPMVERSLWINELLYTKSLSLIRINRIDNLASVKNVTLESTPIGIKVY